MHGFDQAPPARRVLVTIGEQEPNWPPGFPGKFRQPRELIVLVIEVAVHAEGARADGAQRRADRQKLLGIGIARGHHVALRRLVGIGARGGEAERARVQRLDGEAAHFDVILTCCRFQADRALAHDVDAQRQMRNLGGDIDGARPALERIEKIGKAFPFPRQTIGEDGIGNFLHAFHQVHERAAMLRAHRCKADPAIAEQHRGDAMPA